MLIHAISQDHASEDYALAVCVESGSDSGRYIIQQRFIGESGLPPANARRRMPGRYPYGEAPTDLFTAATAAAAAKYVRGFLGDAEESPPRDTLFRLFGSYDLPTCSEFLSAETARQEQEAETLERNVERDMLIQRIEAWDAMPSLSDADWAARRRARRLLAKLPKQNSKRLT